MMARPLSVLSILNQGCDVFVSDTDVVWRDSIWEWFEDQKVDLYVTSDNVYANGRHSACGGNFFIRSRPQSKSLLRLWHRKLVEAKNLTTNQHMWNKALDESKAPKGELNLEHLPMAYFPSGKFTDQYPEATVIHANWVKGEANKIMKLQKLGLWHP